MRSKFKNRSKKPADSSVCVGYSGRDKGFTENLKRLTFLISDIKEKNPRKDIGIP